MSDKKKTHVLVLMGGMSSEHEVSLMSGRKVVAALDPDCYAVTPVTILKTGEWQFPGSAPVSVYDAMPQVRARGVDCVFLALHGEYGEDGRIQGFLDVLDLPYTSSGCAASALAMDKMRSKAVVSAQGICVAGHVALSRDAWRVSGDSVVQTVEKDLGYPCVVKPGRLGSSVGVHIPADRETLHAAVAAALEADEEVLIEEFIRGVEVTCAVLEAEPGGEIRALPVTQIRPKEGAYFDYHCKYTPGATEEITPAEIDEAMTERVQEAAAHVHQILGCSIWSRSDFIIDARGPVWLEVNTIPGLTETSLFPQAAAAAGIPYARLLGIFVEAAIKQHARGKR